MPLDPARINDIVLEHLRERRTELGANLGTLLRRHDPDFRPSELNFASLTALLRTVVDGAVVVGRRGADVIWGLAEDLDDRDLSQALMEEAAEGEPLAPAASDVLEWVELEGFRSCKKARLDVDDLTLLVGANGVGKTSLLLGTSYACQIRPGRISTLFSGSRDLRRVRYVGSAGPVRLTLHARSGAELSLEGRPEPDEVKFTLTHRAAGKGKRTKWELPPPAGQAPVGRSPVEGVTWPALFLRLRPEALAAPSSIEDQHPRLDFDGRGLPTVLALLATTDPGRLEEIVRRVRGMVPQVRRVRLLPRREEHARAALLDGGDAGRRSSGGEFSMRYALEVEMEGSGWTPADMVSEGTLFAFGIHTVLAQERPPRLLLLDDIDRGLHPRAQRTLVQQLQTVVASGTRVIASTHSPSVLDEVPAGNVRVVRSTPTEGTMCRRLTDHPDWHEWESSMKAGEFWSYVGEEWLESGS